MDAVTRREQYYAAMAGEAVTPPEPVTREEQYLSAINSGIGAVKSEVEELSDNRFLVTMTPTALDFSGVLDKTYSEIQAAYEAGKDIWFGVSDGSSATSYLPVSQVVYTTEGTYPLFNTYILYDSMDALIFAFAGGTYADGNSYSTIVYSLTRMT